MEAHVEEIRKHVRAYVLVFVGLAFLTLVTVSVSYLHVSVLAHIAIALFIAVVKGGLVASYFMHLISEKKLIYSVLILTVLFLAALLILPVGALLDHMGS